MWDAFNVKQRSFTAVVCLFDNSIRDLTQIGTKSMQIIHKEFVAVGKILTESTKNCLFVKIMLPRSLHRLSLAMCSSRVCSSRVSFTCLTHKILEKTV